MEQFNDPGINKFFKIAGDNNYYVRAQSGLMKVPPENLIDIRKNTELNNVPILNKEQVGMLAYSLQKAGEGRYSGFKNETGVEPITTSTKVSVGGESGRDVFAKDSNIIPKPVENPSTNTSSTTPKPFGINNISSTLNLGSQGDQVKELQKYLQGMGYTNADGTPLKIDGIYGNNTKTAVMQFQSKNGLSPDGIFGPKSLAATKNITSTGTQEGSNPINNNGSTGTPNTNPNLGGTTYNTGDPANDAALKALQDYIKTQQDAGLKLNKDLNFDQATLDKFLETAKKQIHPFYAQQIDTIKQDVLRVAPQILQNYDAEIANKEANFSSTLDNSRERNADSGLAFSGQRARGELGMQDAQNRDLASLTQSYGNKLYDLGRGAEEKIGSSNVNYDLGALRNYSANLGGFGGFTLGGTTNPYTKGGYKTGSIEYDREAQTEARRQALLKTAGESVVAGRGYQDLFR